MEINVLVMGIEEKHLVESMGVFKTTKEDYSEKYDVVGIIANGSSIGTEYPMKRETIILFSGSKKDANYICDRINRLGGISSHGVFVQLLDNLKRIEEEKAAEENLFRQYRDLDELMNRSGEFLRLISLSLDEKQETVTAIVTVFKTRKVLKEYKLPFPKHDCGGKGILKKVVVLDSRKKEITQFQIRCDKCGNSTMPSSESGAIENWITMSIGVRIWRKDD